MLRFFLKRAWFIVFIFTLLILARSIDVIVKNIVTTTASQIVGAPVSVDYLDFGVVKSSIVIRGLKVYNPADFPPGILVDLKEVRVDYDLSALLKKDLHFPLMAIDLNEMVIIKDKNGKLNTDSLKIVRDYLASQSSQAPADLSQAKPIKMRIDVVKLNINRVICKDLSAVGSKQVLVHEIGIKNRTYKNITSPQQLATLIMVKAMETTAIKSAAIYGAATALGVTFLPVGVMGMLFSKSHATEDFLFSYEQVYRACGDVVRSLGTIKKERQAKGIFEASVYGADVQAAVKSLPQGKVRVTVSARKMTLPKPEIAAGILYQIKERLEDTKTP